MKVDLHTHTDRSDGTLSPTGLLEYLRDQGVEVASITDHDTLAAYDDRLDMQGLTLIPGVEFSANVGTMGVHIVGLGVEPNGATMRTASERQQSARARRADAIALALEKVAGTGLRTAASELAGGRVPGRPHFAQALVEQGLVKNSQQAFKRYLGKGKRGHVATDWPDMQTVNGWIRDAGGVSVLAHPARYRLNRNKLLRLVREFCEAGGEAIEVISGKQDPATTRQLAEIAESHKLLASKGSDFHSPTQTWLKPGRLPPLPSICVPVWEHLPLS